MKNPQRGSTAVILLVLIIIVLIVVFGTYVYFQKSETINNVEGPKSVNTQSSTISNKQNSISPHITSVTPFVDINGNTQFNVVGTGFLDSTPFVDGKSATYSASSLTNATVMLISVKQLATSGTHSVYMMNLKTGQKSNVVEFTK